MCYQSGMVSFATDPVGHAVGVLGVGLLDTDWTCWAGRSWSLWLLPACESLVRSAHGAASTGPPVRSWQLPSCLPVERRSCCTWSMLLRVVSVTSPKLCIKHSPVGRRPFEQIWSWRELHLLLSYAFWYLDSWGRWVHTCRTLQYMSTDLFFRMKSVMYVSWLTLWSCSLHSCRMFVLTVEYGLVHMGDCMNCETLYFSFDPAFVWPDVGRADFHSA